MSADPQEATVKMNVVKLFPGRDWREPALGMEFVWIDDLGIWVGRYMVTNEEFRFYRPNHDSGDYEGLALNRDRQPVVQVSFHEAMAFCDWLSEQSRAANFLGANQLFRLPSHLEWTSFARCGDGRDYPWGNNWPPHYGNFGDQAAKRQFPDWDGIEDYDDGFIVSCPVDDSGENDWGLWGVGGNAYEWTFEAGGVSSELRGGSWSTFQPEYLRINNRYRREPSSKLFNFGFRVVLVG